MTLTEGKRGQVIDAAIAEFRDRGFAGASMDRVASLAQVSKRTVYNHFESKEALFRAIIEMLSSEASASYVLDFDPSVPIAEQLISLGWTMGRLMMDPGFMKLARMVVCEAIRDPELSERASGKMEATVFVRGFLADAVAGGALRINDVDVAAKQFVGLIKAQAFWPVIFSGVTLDERAVARVIASTVEMFLRQYARDEFGKCP
ncbi:MAG: TetR/AcrR family transcriptional regulator [Pseudomonadota bacterium]